ncbi:hypothetical protein N0V82_005354 [Gnomoniopsis sp. IMI 355080]|nr:hypothetical protein N0V82_005354 [Gnomoniopsis sp. IMI 355080]
MDLPIEIRYRILSYTDLVTPLQEVQWNPVEKYHLEFRHLLCCKSVKEFWGCWASCPSMGNWIPSDTPGWHYPVVKSTHRDNGLFHHGCTFRNCWQQVDLGGCFCQRYHAATSSSTRNQCRCWVPPLALFLAGRQLYHDAQAVFFAQNRIIVRSHDGPGSTQLTDIQRFAILGRYPASAFLRGGIAPSSLRYLRFLDLVFPPVDHETSMTTPALTDWLETLDWARNKLDRPRLTIRLEITDYTDERSVPPSRQTLDPKQARQIIKGCSDIVRGLMALRGASGPGLGEAGLRRIFIHLANPFDGPGNLAPPGSRRGGREWWERSQPEKKFECSIMGYDYDSRVHGKDEFKLAEWKWEQILRAIY